MFGLKLQVERTCAIMEISGPRKRKFVIIDSAAQSLSYCATTTKKAILIPVLIPLSSVPLFGVMISVSIMLYQPAQATTVASFLPSTGYDATLDCILTSRIAAC